MFSSHIEFFCALREENYFAALEWIEFLASTYSLEGDGDTLLTLAVYHLIYFDFKASDFHLIQVAYNLGRSLRDKFDYAGTVLCNAALQVLVYEDQDLLKFYKSESLLQSATEIMAWMSRNSENWNSHLNNEALCKKMILLDTRSLALEKKTMVAVEKIEKKSEYKKVLSDYKEFLMRELKEKDDQLTALRLGLVCAVLEYIQAQYYLTPIVERELHHFINELRLLDPDLREDNFLNRLQPKSLSDNFTLRLRQGIHFLANIAVEHLVLNGIKDNCIESGGEEDREPIVKVD